MSVRHALVSVGGALMGVMCMGQCEWCWSECEGCESECG